MLQPEVHVATLPTLRDPDQWLGTSDASALPHGISTGPVSGGSGGRGAGAGAGGGGGSEGGRGGGGGGGGGGADFVAGSQTGSMAARAPVSVFDRPAVAGPRIPLGGHANVRPGLAEVVFNTASAEAPPPEALRKGATPLRLESATPFAHVLAEL